MYELKKAIEAVLVSRRPGFKADYDNPATDLVNEGALDNLAKIYLSVKSKL